MLRATESAGQAAGRASTAPADDPAWAWAPYKRDASRPWDLRLAGHLYQEVKSRPTTKTVSQSTRLRRGLPCATFHGFCSLRPPNPSWGAQQH